MNCSLCKVVIYTIVSCRLFQSTTPHTGNAALRPTQRRIGFRPEEWTNSIHFCGNSFAQFWTNWPSSVATEKCAANLQLMTGFASKFCLVTPVSGTACMDNGAVYRSI